MIIWWPDPELNWGHKDFQPVPRLVVQGIVHYDVIIYYGDAEGQCLVRYDNETGKGDHKHLGEEEVAYQFVDVKTLLKDFQRDIYRCQKIRRKMK